MSTLQIAPERTLAQRHEALDRANYVRISRSVLKRDLKAGRVHPADLIADPPDYAEGMGVVDVLIALPRWGRVKALKALGQCGASPVKTIGGLTARQRRELVARLSG